MTNFYISDAPPVVARLVALQELAYDDMVAGAALSQFDVVYMDGTFIRRAQANNIATMPGLGMARLGVSSGLQVDVLFRGLLSNGAWSGLIVSGQPVYVNPNSAGLITASSPPNSGNVAQRLGMGRTNTSLELHVEDNYIVVSA